MFDLTAREKKELIDCCDNFYDDEVPGASKALPVIQAKIKREEELTREELRILVECLDRDTHDMEAAVNNSTTFKLLEEIQQKIEIELRKISSTF